jgi:hypothetical protein
MRQNRSHRLLQLLCFFSPFPSLLACGPAKKICEEFDEIPYEDCGTCVCKYGSWDCSTRACNGDGDTGSGDGDTGDGDTGDGDTGGGDGDSPIPGSCNDGDTISTDCSQCTCTNGRWTCSQSCDGYCEPGTEFTGDCGRCECNNEGQWQCDDRSCPVAICEGVFSDGCGSGRYCLYPEGAFCGVGLRYGVCANRQNDACDDIYDPVCGCNYENYGNACEAAVAGMSVLFLGPCPTPPPR